MKNFKNDSKYKRMFPIFRERDKNKTGAHRCYRRSELFRLLKWRFVDSLLCIIYAVCYDSMRIIPFQVAIRLLAT